MTVMAMAKELGSDCICGVIRLVIGVCKTGAAQSLGAVKVLRSANETYTTTYDSLPPIGWLHAHPHNHTVPRFG